MKSSAGKADRPWGLVTNHGYVLACIAADPETRLRDIAETVGITERTAGQIVNDLERAGYLAKTRVGRRNRYEVKGEARVRMPQLQTMTIGEVIALLLQTLERQPFA
jgi:DNA-binding MarR family transcriptional regulator